MDIGVVRDDSNETDNSGEGDGDQGNGNNTDSHDVGLNDHEEEIDGENGYEKEWDEDSEDGKNVLHEDRIIIDEKDGNDVVRVIDVESSYREGGETGEKDADKKMRKKGEGRNDFVDDDPEDDDHVMNGEDGHSVQQLQNTTENGCECSEKDGDICMQERSRDKDEDHEMDDVDLFGVKRS